MKLSKVVALCMTGVLLTGTITGCSKANKNTQTAISGDSLKLSSYASKWSYNATYDVYYLENVVYCSKPVDSSLQSLNIYVPAAYMNKDGSIKKDASITNSNGTKYTSTNAPVVYSNGVWGYSEAKPGVIDDATAEYVKEGYILVCAGSRGKETVNSNGSYVGKAPEGLVDLKAGIRFLKSNDDTLAGSSDRIISIGLSAGGGMSSLLGSTGNSKDYTSYLKEIGAVMTETDDVYGAMAYCPITDLENSDVIYEWMFTSDTTYSGNAAVNRRNNSSNGDTKNFAGKGAAGSKGELTEEQKQAYRDKKQNGTNQSGTQSETEMNEFQKALSGDLAALYPNYVNSLNLGLTLNADGRSGSYYKAMMEVVSNALNDYLSKNYKTSSEKEAYIKTLNENATWVKWDANSKKASINDIDAFVKNYLGRAKTVPGFDALDLSAQENKMFGNTTTQLSHYSSSLATLLSNKDYSSLTGYDVSSIEAYKSVLKDESLQTQVALMNPFYYIGTEKKTTIAPYFRIRVGTQDADSAFATAFNLATALQKAGANVDYAMLWGQGHRVMEQNGEFVDWVDQICQK